MLATAVGLGVVCLAWAYSPGKAPAADNAGPGNPGTETIVVVRHGEKPSEAKGQLSCQGLNRALSLPTVLARYGKPAAIFAADPSAGTTEGSISPWATRYSYVRPLATIEPYAVAQDMPVNTQIAATNIQGLQQELLKPGFARSTVVVAWEHIQARKFAENMLTSFGQSEAVPHWSDSDYETIYVFRIATDNAGARKLNFAVEHEDLKDLPTTCPGITPPAAPQETKPATDGAVSATPDPANADKPPATTPDSAPKAAPGTPPLTPAPHP